jgi:hypothetical protein
MMLHRPTCPPMRGRLIRLAKRAKQAARRCAGVVATARTQGKNARNSGNPAAWSVVATNLRPVTVREDAMGWRKGP